MGDLAQLTDEGLVARIGSRDHTALQHLFERHSRLVLRIAQLVLHDYGEAEELVQEVFLYVYQKADLFDPCKGSARGWIVQLTYHRAFNRRAYLSRRGFYLRRDVVRIGNTLLGDADLDRQIGQKFSRKQLERALKELPAGYRRTLELFYFEGLELREISERMNESLANVRHHYYRGLKKLRSSPFIHNLRDGGRQSAGGA